MPINYYDEDQAQTSQGKRDKEPGPKSTALLPKSILMGKRAGIGDTITLRIDKILEDQLSVSYESAPTEEPESSEMEEEMAMPVDEGAMKSQDSFYE